MKKINLTVYVITLLAAVLLSIPYYFYFRNGQFKDEVFDVLCGIVVFSIGGLFEYWRENRDLLIVNFKCLYTGIKYQEIYISFSYLLRIKVDGFNKYLLVKGSKIQHQYQPVGGVYQRYQSSQLHFDSWSARPARDEHNPYDLRFRVKGKYVPDVIRWFHSRQNREIDVWREFYEELIETKILPSAAFTSTQAEFLYSCPEYLIERHGIRGKQVLIYDIYRINLSNEQIVLLKELLTHHKEPGEYAFVDEEDLDNGCFKHNGIEYRLGGHTKYLLQKF